MQSLRVKYSLEIQRTGYRRGSAQAFHLSVPGSSLLGADKKTWQIWSKLEKGLPKSELIEPLSPQAAQLGIHFYIAFTTHS